MRRDEFPIIDKVREEDYQRGREDAIDAISELVRNSSGWRSYEAMIDAFQRRKEQKNE